MVPMVRITQHILEKINLLDYKLITYCKVNQSNVVEVVDFFNSRNGLILFHITIMASNTANQKQSQDCRKFYERLIVMLLWY